MDTKFSVALHILTMISESQATMTSQALATSVGTNASYIRKVIALLKNAGIIQSHQGKAGYELSKNPAEISLLDIYYATQEVTRIQLFQQHQHANQACPVGRHIAGAVSPIFSKIEQDLQTRLSEETLADVIANLYQEAKKSN